MRAKRMSMLVGVVALAVGGCSGDDTEQLQQETERLQAEVEMLRSERELAAARYEKSSSTIAAAEAILADPEAFGSESEIVSAIADLATADAQIEDDVFGSIDYATGYYETLFGGRTDAVIDVYDHWLSDDGSQGGSLWIWRGTNAAGNAFELAGISLMDFDDEGRIEHELVTYPYADEYVVDAFEGAGSGFSAEVRDNPRDGPFSFADDDLCEWLTAGELSAILAAEFDGIGAEESTPVEDEACAWRLTGGDDLSQMSIWPADHSDDAIERYPDAQTSVSIGKLYVGHPSLSPGVAVEYGGFGYVAFGVPGPDRYLQFFLMVPAKDDPAEDEAARFAVADAILHELGWLDRPASEE